MKTDPFYDLFVIKVHHNKYTVLTSNKKVVFTTSYKANQYILNSVRIILNNIELLNSYVDELFTTIKKRDLLRTDTKSAKLVEDVSSAKKKYFAAYNNRNSVSDRTYSMQEMAIITYRLALLLDKRRMMKQIINISESFQFLFSQEETKL